MFLSAGDGFLWTLNDRTDAHYLLLPSAATFESHKGFETIDSIFNDLKLCRHARIVSRFLLFNRRRR